MSLVVYTALFGPHAKPLPQPKWTHPDVPMLCFTDQDLRCDPWQMIQLPAEPDPFRGNRRLKLLSHQTVDSEWSLYIDSNYSLLKDPRELLGQGDFCVHRHHACTDIVEEAAAIIRFRKADPTLVLDQVAEYQRQGFCTPENPQRHHSANAVLLRHHTPEVCALNEAWWAELEQHSHRDQLSLDFCAWRANFALSHWPGTMLDNPYFDYGQVRRPLPRNYHVAMRRH